MGIQWGDTEADWQMNSNSFTGAKTDLGNGYSEYKITVQKTNAYPIQTGATDCQYRLNVYITVNGTTCTSTKTYKVTVWSRDDRPKGVFNNTIFLDNTTNKNEYLVCEGKPWEITFRNDMRLACNNTPNGDNSYTPNEYERQTQYVKRSSFTTKGTDENKGLIKFATFFLFFRNSTV